MPTVRELLKNKSGDLWTVSPDGGPSELLPAPTAHDGSYSPEGTRIAVDPVTRWDVEWRNYRGGQNRPLGILDLGDLGEVQLPNERTTDTQPLWLGCDRGLAKLAMYLVTEPRAAVRDGDG